MKAGDGARETTTRTVGVGVCRDQVAGFAQFAANLPPGSGLCVLAAHDLDAAGVAGLIEAARAHARVHVAQAKDGDALAGDRVLVAPAGSTLVVGDGRVGVLAAGDRPVDSCLLSLAAQLGDAAIAALLCAPMHDGARGARAIKEAGGLIVGVDSSAEGVVDFGAVAPGLADSLLQPADMPRALVAYIRRPPVAASDDEVEERTRGRADLERIIGAIHAQTGVDFSEYKRSTLVRRIERRMGICQVESFADYLDLLQHAPLEVTTLFRELLIGVTRFFRDEEAFVELRDKVIPQLIHRDRSQEPIRVWVAGCSTGEEAYSIAILFREALEALDRQVPVKIFATDLDRDAVEYASLGQYPESIVGDVSRERLERFFTRKGDVWQIAKPVREMVIFAPHNLAKDPPFYRIDLITCRNLLIYLQPPLQRRLFSTFHFALNAGGFLMLGTSETLGDMGAFFHPVDAKWKIYQKKGGKKLPLMIEAVPPERGRAQPLMARAAAPKPQASGLSEEAQEALTDAIVHEFMPASLVVNEAFDIVHVFGEVDRYLKLPPGKPTFNVLKMAPRELAVALGTGIRKALKDGERVVFENVAADRDAGGDAPRIKLTVRPLAARKDLGKFAMVVFEDLVERDRPGEHFDLEDQAGQRIRDLELEIEQTSESLQAAIEELETSNEELQATNEEVLAANEELQSTNEELQSVNEELYTVNSEYQAKIGELTELNNDLLNFLSSTNIGTIFLDQRLCIRKFTPSITQQINLIDKDIGRPLEHISHNLVYHDLVADAEDVLRTLVPKQKEVRSKAGAWYLMRLMPYRTEDNVIKGVVLTFIDISEVKTANESVRKLMLVLEQCVELVMITRADGVIEYVNQRFCDVTGYAKSEVLGRTPAMLKSGRMLPTDFQRLWETLLAGNTWQGSFINKRKDGSLFREEAVIVAMRDVEGKITNFLKTTRSVSPAS